MNQLRRPAFRFVSRLVVVAVGFMALSVIGPVSGAARPGVHEEVITLPAFAAPVLVQQVRVSAGAEMLGLTWHGDADARFSVRAFDGTSWTEWLALDDNTGQQPDGKGTSRALTAGPAWLARDFHLAEVRVDQGAPGVVEVHALDVASTSSGGFALGPRAAGAVVAPPFIASRADWGADESWRNMYPNCTTPDYASTVDFAVIHHTVNSNNYGPGDSAGLIRGIYYFHTHSNGWCDIGYNFLIDRFGQIFEGRFGGGHKAVIGAHAGGFNTGSTGVAMLGDYDAAPVPAAAYGALRNLLAWKLKYHGIDPLGTATHRVADSDCNCQKWPPGTVVTIPTIVGHRDVDSTGCPGSNLYPLLPQLRRDVAAIVNAARNADQAIVCDWNGDGRSTPALYQNGTFYIRQSDSEGAPDLAIHYGDPSYIPVCGDWNGDGVDTIGVYFQGWWYLRNSNSPGPPDRVVHYGMAGYTPVVGNWNGLVVPGVKGDGIGVFVGDTWYLRQTPSEGPAEIKPFAYGAPWSRPVVGDWNGDGVDGVGVYDAGWWYLRQTASAGSPDRSVVYGRGTDRPVAGDWTKAGADSPGVARGAWWYLGSLAGISASEFPLLLFYA